MNLIKKVEIDAKKGQEDIEEADVWLVFIAVNEEEVGKLSFIIKEDTFRNFEV